MFLKYKNYIFNIKFQYVMTYSIFIMEENDIVLR